MVRAPCKYCTVLKRDGCVVVLLLLVHLPYASRCSSPALNIMNREKKKTHFRGFSRSKCTSAGRSWQQAAYIFYSVFQVFREVRCSGSVNIFVFIHLCGCVHAHFVSDYICQCTGSRIE